MCVCMCGSEGQGLRSQVLLDLAVLFPHLVVNVAISPIKQVARYHHLLYNATYVVTCRNKFIFKVAIRTNRKQWEGQCCASLVGGPPDSASRLAPAPAPHSRQPTCHFSRSRASTSCISPTHSVAVWWSPTFRPISRHLPQARCICFEFSGVFYLPVKL